MGSTSPFKIPFPLTIDKQGGAPIKMPTLSMFTRGRTLFVYKDYDPASNGTILNFAPLPARSPGTG